MSFVEALKPSGRNLRYWQVAVLVFVLLAWQWASRNQQYAFFLGEPLKVAGRVWSWFMPFGFGESSLFPEGLPGRADIYPHLGVTLLETALAFVIGTVARLAEHKGHDDLLDALGEDLRAHPHWRLLWVGDGWWRDRLLIRAEHMGLRGRVLTTGLVPPERVPGLVRAMDILAHPSYREGLPRTVPQALLCGVPPVAYEVDGTAEVCREGETGRLVPPGDRAALRRAVLDLYDDPDARRRLAQRGHAECTERFDARPMVEALERVYALAIEDAGRG